MPEPSAIAEAWLALWNGFDPALDAEYNTWHAQEHVPERLTVPGMRCAGRYRAIGESVYPYFTLYEMDSLDVLESPEYQALLRQPTPWSRRMRASFGKLLRIPCRVLEKPKTERGQALLSVETRGASRADVHAALSRIVDLLGVVGLRAGFEDTTIAPLPWRDGAQTTTPTDAASLLLIEAQTIGDLRPIAEALPTEITSHRPAIRLHSLLTFHQAHS